MKVLIVEPGKYPRKADIEHTLEAEQAPFTGNHALPRRRMRHSGRRIFRNLSVFC